MSANILHLETSTKTCSVALSSDDKLLSLVESMDLNYSHAEKLNMFIEEAMNKAGLEMKDLSAIAISKGPGSFTGLRIGVSSAKGLAYALDIPLISCNTLHSLAKGFLLNNALSSSDLIVPMIDARREEVYMNRVDNMGEILSDVEAKVITVNSFDDETEKGMSVHLIGDGAAKFEDLFKDIQNVIVHKEFHPSAQYMLPLSGASFKDEKFEDLAYFEPYYLKDFIAIKPRKIF